MAQYDVTHIDDGRYRELRRLVQDGRARAVIVVEYLDGNTSQILCPSLTGDSISETATPPELLLSSEHRPWPWWLR